MTERGRAGPGSREELSPPQSPTRVAGALGCFLRHVSRALEREKGSWDTDPGTVQGGFLSAALMLAPGVTP